MPAPFISTFEQIAEGRLCVWAVGELDLAAAPMLSEAIASCVLKRPVELVVDLGGVTFMDSSGLRVLIDGHRIATDNGVPLVLRQVPPQVQRVFELTGTSDLFEHQAD